MTSTAVKTSTENARERAIVTKRVNEFLASGFSHTAANLTKPVFKGWNWEGGSPDDDIIENLPIIRQRTRQLAMEAPVIAGFHETRVTNIIGGGLTLEPTPDMEYLELSSEAAQKLKSQQMRLFDMWAESKACDYRRQNNFYELQRLAMRAKDESGDTFITMPMIERGNEPFALKLHVIEADCITDPQGHSMIEAQRDGRDIMGGVETDSWGQVLAYWVSTKHPLSQRRGIFPYNPLEEYVRIPAFGEESGRQNILHLMAATRPGQRRGVPLTAVVVEVMLILDRYIKAEATAAQIQALFTAVVTSEGDPEVLAGEMEALSAGDDTNLEESEIGLGSGIIQYARPGEGIECINPTRPTNVYQNFIETTLQMMGPALKMPHELLLQKFQSSYSASRAAFSMANANLKVDQRAFVQDCNQPIYEAFMDECVARGMIHAPGYWTDPLARRAYTRAKWNGPALPHIDPLKEIQAASRMIELGVKTASQATSELTGGDWYENVAEREREIEAAKKAGIESLAGEVEQMKLFEDGKHE